MSPTSSTLFGYYQALYERLMQTDVPPRWFIKDIGLGLSFPSVEGLSYVGHDIYSIPVLTRCVPQEPGQKALKHCRLFVWAICNLLVCRRHAHPTREAWTEADLYRAAMEMVQKDNIADIIASRETKGLAAALGITPAKRTG